jgi:hypothetical protein
MAAVLLQAGHKQKAAEQAHERDDQLLYGNI